MCLETYGHRQPRLPVGEAGIGTVIPLHGRALAIAALLLRPTASSDRIFDFVASLRVVILHADLFAVVHDGRAAQREQQRGHQSCNLIIVLAIAIAIVVPHLVVIAKDPHWPPMRWILVPLGDLLAEF